MRKYSRQREVIKEFLKDRTDHPTADTIYTGVRQEIPNISLGTVYRNLMLLSEEGEIARLTVGDGTVHFDPNTTEHTHFVCTHCGCVQDLSIPNTEGLNQAAGAHFQEKLPVTDLYSPDCVKIVWQKKSIKTADGPKLCAVLQITIHILF